MEGYIQYYRGIPSVLWGITAVHVGDSFSTVEDNFSTVGDSFSTVEDNFSTVGVASVLWRITSVQWGIASVLWRIFSTLGSTSVHAREYISTVGVTSVLCEYSVQWGDTFSTVGDNISTVEVAQYSGDKDFKHYVFSKNLEIFSRAYFASKSDRPHHNFCLNC